jgi:hypothetical protein
VRRRDCLGYATATDGGALPGVHHRIEGDAVSDKLPYDAECNASKAAMERFLRALVEVDGHFTDSFYNHPLNKPHTTVYFRVWLPPGTEQRFARLAQIEAVKPPAVPDLGWCADINTTASKERSE